jgi:hypothetical protein
LYFAGLILREKSDIGAGLQLLRRAVALEPKVPNIWMHYGACLHDVHQYEDARKAFTVVHKALPQDPMPLANIAATYVQQGNARLAVEYADRALELDPQSVIASVSKAFGCLALGRWADGWERQQYLYGDHLTIRVYNDPAHEEPQWDGTKGQTVVVQADQGLGDVIMFAQCLPQLIRDCKKVIIDADPRLADLLRRNFPECDVYGTMDDLTRLEWPLKYQIDAHIHISYLGKFYRTTDAEFPRTAYLTADLLLRSHWREYLEQFPRPWVGLTWRGGIQKSNEAARSFGLEEYRPLLESGGTFVSLCYQRETLQDVARWNIDNHAQVRIPGIAQADDYDQWLALVAELDHVVTVTTTIAHACGALGKRAAVLVNRHPQWRYCYGGDSLMWYPEDSLSLYRQKPGEQGWAHPIARVTEHYRNFVVA